MWKFCVTNGTRDCFITTDKNAQKLNWHVTSYSSFYFPGEIEPADTPDGNDESPNDTGTAIKNATTQEPIPHLKGLIKRRRVLSTTLEMNFMNFYHTSE